MSFFLSQQIINSAKIIILNKINFKNLCENHTFALAIETQS